MKTQTELHTLRMALSSLMKEQGLTQLDVCRETRIKQSAVSLFLSGRRGLNGDSALRLMRFLKASEVDPCQGAAPPADPARDARA